MRVHYLRIVFIVNLVFLNCGSGQILNYNDTRTELKNMLFQHSKPLILSSIKNINISEACRMDSEFFLESLENLDLWAVQMYDATAKAPSGLTNGNIQVTGDLNMCIKLVEKSSKNRIKGKYCLAQIYVEPVRGDIKISEIMNLVHSYKAYQTKFEDENDVDIYFLPSFTRASWGFCIPQSCSSNDLENFLHHTLKPYNHTTGLEIKLRVRPYHCLINEEETYSFFSRNTFIWIFLIIWNILIITGSIYDYYHKYELCDIASEKLYVQILYAFCLRRSWNLLMAEDFFDDDIPCVHGLRTIFSFAIYILHKGMFEYLKPFTNRTESVEFITGPPSMFIRVFFNHIGTFTIFSGLLTSYFATKKLKQVGKLNILSMYITRYLKFFPGLMVIFISVDMNLGYSPNPNMFNIVHHLSKMCYDHLWQRLFLVENWYGLNDMCYPPAHQLYSDFQLYLTAPFIVLLLWKYSKHAMKILIVLIFGFSALTAFTTYQGHYSMLFYFGRSLKDAKESFDTMYTNPLYWMVFYLFGIGLGYYLQKTKSLVLTKEKRILGWIIAAFTFYYSFFGISEISQKNYKYNLVKETIFATIQPITWSFTICWIIYCCQAGYGGYINTFLSWKKFTIFSKLAFAFYINQVGIIWKSSTSIALVPQYFRLSEFISLSELSLIIFSAIMLTLWYMIPTWHILFLIKTSFSQGQNTNSVAKSNINKTQ